MKFFRGLVALTFSTRTAVSIWIAGGVAVISLVAGLWFLGHGGWQAVAFGLLLLATVIPAFLVLLIFGKKRSAGVPDQPRGS